MPTSTLTSKGQITLPKEVRERLGLRTGDRVHFIIQPDGQIIVNVATIDIKQLEGILHRKGMKAVTVQEMNRAIRKRFNKAL